MKKIILINTSDVGAESSAEAIKKLGFEPVFIINTNAFLGDTLTQVKQYQYYHVDHFDTESLLGCITENNITEIEGVMTTLDSGICPSIELGQALEVRTMPDVLVKLDDKAYVANIIPEYSPKSIHFAVEDYSFSIVQEMLAFCQKLLLKPTNAAGGNGVLVISNDTKGDQVQAHLSKFPHKNWILMEYINGDLFSMEGFVQDGVINFIGATSRQKIGNTESVMAFPLNKMLAPNVWRQAKSAIADLVERAEYQFGYFHTEFILEAEQCFLIDANFGRVGGGPLVDMIAQSYETPVEDIFSHLVSLTLFPEKNIQSPFEGKIAKDVYGINYGINKTATLDSVAFDKHLNVKHTVLLETNSKVPKMGDDNWAWIGMVSGQKNEVEEFMDSLKIQTCLGEMEPCY